MQEIDPIPLADGNTDVPVGVKLPGPLDVVIEEAEPPPPPPITRRSFAADVINSYLFIIEPSNLIPFTIVSIFTALGAALVLVGTGVFVWRNVGILVLGLVVGGVFACAWVAAYCVRIVEEVASDEDDLPSTEMGGLTETVIKPMITFVITWGFLLLPAGVLLLARARWGLRIPDLWIQTAFWAGIALWPMAILCVAIGGVSSFFRADLMIYTIFRTLAGYTLIWCLLLATGGLAALIIWLLALPNAAGVSRLNAHPLPVIVFTAILVAYAEIVSMRLIGLYYRHYKHRFAWSWE